MPYVEGQTIHDADSHVMELPGTINRYIDPKFRDALRRADRAQGVLPEWFAKIQAHAGRPGVPRRRRGQPPAAQELPGAGRLPRRRPARRRSTTWASPASWSSPPPACRNFGLEQMGEVELAVEAARAHNRMMTEFCCGRPPAAGHRLCAADRPRPRAADRPRGASRLGAKALVIPSRHPPGFSPSHVELDPLWALAQEAGLPILFHVGGEEKMATDYLENGLPFVKDFHGGDENFTSLTFMAIPLQLWQTLSALVIDGVFDRFPRLKLGRDRARRLLAAQPDAVPGFRRRGLRQGGAAAEALRPSPARSCAASSASRPIRTRTPAGSSRTPARRCCLFSSDFPHVEGGRNPLKRFNDSLEGVVGARRSGGSSATTSST